MKNSYVGRTFIQPSQTIRQLGIRLKLNPLAHVIEGKRLVVVDDSIVRGNTQRALVRMLREAGAREVHVRISSPPVKWPCFYGIDFATRAELIANGLGVDEIRAGIDADSLGYISAEEHGRPRPGSRASAVPGLLRRGLPDRRCPTRSSSASTCSSGPSRSSRPTPRVTATRRVSASASPGARRTRSTAPDRPSETRTVSSTSPPERRTRRPASPSTPATRPSS